MKDLKLLTNIYNPNHGSGFAGGVWDIYGISPTIKASEYKGQTFILVVSNEKSNTNNSN